MIISVLHGILRNRINWSSPPIILKYPTFGDTSGQNSFNIYVRSKKKKNLYYSRSYNHQAFYFLAILLWNNNGNLSSGNVAVYEPIIFSISKTLSNRPFISFKKKTSISSFKNPSTTHWKHRLMVYIVSILQTDAKAYRFIKVPTKISCLFYSLHYIHLKFHTFI